MQDDPQEIADYLIRERGWDGADQTIFDAIAKANTERDLYGLSIWREVRIILRERKRSDREAPK